MILKAMKQKFAFSEAYFLENVKKIKPRLSIPVILVGGLRTPSVMNHIIEENYADMVAIGRPLIREPDFPNKLLKDHSYTPTCINCNRCFIRISQAKALRCYAQGNMNTGSDE
jgi:2,4-dienoyl-CoA reductase-like NADH-dependent reductase (Old Yellow Enzyme family)